MPTRIQRKRTKGWSMPENTVAVTRPTFWGNPFVIGGHYRRNVGLMTYVRAFEGYQDEKYTTIKTAEEAVEWYRWYASLPHKTKAIKTELRGKNLACWCKPGMPCHADVLLELANAAAEN